MTIRISGVGTVIQSNVFSANGAAQSPQPALEIVASAVDTRVLSNVHANNCPVDSGSKTQFSHDVDLTNCCP